MTTAAGAEMSGSKGTYERSALEDQDYATAFARAYETYYARVFAYLYSRVNNVELAKDLTAEVFEKAYMKGHSVREERAYASWLFMIAKNTVAGHFRKEKRAHRGLERIKESLWTEGHVAEPSEQAIHSEAVSRLWQQARTLSRRDQELLALKFDAELTNAEIGRVVNMSEVNVRVCIFRALVKLRQRLREMEGR